MVLKAFLILLKVYSVEFLFTRILIVNHRPGYSKLCSSRSEWDVFERNCFIFVAAKNILEEPWCNRIDVTEYLTQEKVEVHCNFTYLFGLHKRRKGTNTIKSKREPDTVGQKIQGLTKQKVKKKSNWKYTIYLAIYIDYFFFTNILCIENLNIRAEQFFQSLLTWISYYYIDSSQHNYVNTHVWQKKLSFNINNK